LVKVLTAAKDARLLDSGSNRKTGKTSKHVREDTANAEGPGKEDNGNASPTSKKNRIDLVMDISEMNHKCDDVVYVKVCAAAEGSVIIPPTPFPRHDAISAIKHTIHEIKGVRREAIQLIQGHTVIQDNDELEGTELSIQACFIATIFQVHDFSVGVEAAVPWEEGTIPTGTKWVPGRAMGEYFLIWENEPDQGQRAMDEATEQMTNDVYERCERLDRQMHQLPQFRQANLPPTSREDELIEVIQKKLQEDERPEKKRRARKRHTAISINEPQDGYVHEDQIPQLAILLNDTNEGNHQKEDTCQQMATLDQEDRPKQRRLEDHEGDRRDMHRRWCRAKHCTNHNQSIRTITKQSVFNNRINRFMHFRGSMQSRQKSWDNIISSEAADIHWLIPRSAHQMHNAKNGEPHIEVDPPQDKTRPRCKCHCGCQRRPGRLVQCSWCGQSIGPGCCMIYEKASEVYCHWCQLPKIWDCDYLIAPPPEGDCCDQWIVGPKMIFRYLL